MAQKLFTQEQVLNLIRRRQGRKSDTQFAAELGVSASYLSLIRARIQPPGPKILRGLGLKTVYVQNGKR